jgi:hypothetical protein
VELEATESARGRLIRNRYAAVLGVGLRLRRSKTLIDRLQSTSDEDAYQLRARVASALRSLVKTVRIAGAGERPVFGIEHINKAFPHAGIDQTDWRYFEVWLKDNSMQIVKPDLNDPLIARAQLASRGYMSSKLNETEPQAKFGRKVM